MKAHHGTPTKTENTVADHSVMGVAEVRLPAEMPQDFDRTMRGISR
jgi:hypothetical protein